MAKGIGTLGITSSGNISEQTAPKNAFKPQNVTGSAAILGPVIDRLRFDACLVAVAYGAVAGGAGSVSMLTKLRHGANSDGTTDWADVTAGSGGSVASKTDTDPADPSVSVSFYDLTHLERYIRLSITPTLVTSTGQQTGAVLVPAAYRGELPAS